MPDEQRSYVIFLPKSLDLEKRRAHGNIKIIHEGTHSENMELSFPLNSEEANGIEIAIRRAAVRWLEKIRAPQDVISG